MIFAILDIYIYIIKNLFFNSGTDPMKPNSYGHGFTCTIFACKFQSFTSASWETTFGLLRSPTNSEQSVVLCPLWSSSLRLLCKSRVFLGWRFEVFLWKLAVVSGSHCFVFSSFAFFTAAPLRMLFSLTQVV